MLEKSFESAYWNWDVAVSHDPRIYGSSFLIKMDKDPKQKIYHFLNNMEGPSLLSFPLIGSWMKVGNSTKVGVAINPWIRCEGICRL